MLNNKKAEFIVEWLRNYSDNSKTKGFVIGISGGIDSAVTSTLCALTGKPLLCLNMPIRQNAAEYDRGMEHIKWLKENFTNVTFSEVNLSAAFSCLELIYPEDVQDDLTMANTRSRLRMMTLYTFAGHNNMLVVGTGNKVEDFGIGFYTKYGDGGVDLSPIADLMKSEVYKMGKDLGIVESILNARPTDGLWANGATDEDQIGATYDELEWAMTYLSKLNGIGFIEIESITERQKEVLDIYKKRNKANQHKMIPIPVCIIPENL